MISEGELNSKKWEDTDAIVDIVINELSMHPHILGGSRRFGWADEESDYDFFVYAPDFSHVSINLARNLARFNTDIKVDIDHIKYDVNSVRFSVHYLMHTKYIDYFKKIVDINFFPYEQDYNNLVDQHIIVDNVLLHNPVTRQVVSHLKFGSAISGIQIFRALLACGKAGFDKPEQKGEEE